jgi:copper oxidase (laccase) domain-containing protein
MSFAEAGDMKFGDLGSAANRERFLLGAGFGSSRVRGLALSHSRNVLFPSRGDDPAVLAQALGGADGIVLCDSEFAASVTVADCMPIWVLDRVSGAFGILHSGWRGTGILEVALRGIADHFGSPPSWIAVILGPAIGQCCYAVPKERAERFSAEFGEESVSLRGGSCFLDLRAANVSIAERSGIGHLLSIEACTVCDERLGSYRRQGGASFTRMLAICGRPASSPEDAQKGHIA